MRAKQRLRAGSARLLFVLTSLFTAACQTSSQSPAGPTVGRELGTVAENRLNEISGLAASRRNASVLWVHDDGDIQEVFAVDASGAVLAEVRLNRKLADCEDVALGPRADGTGDYLYLGDIGDNDQERDTIEVLRLPEPTLTPRQRVEIDAIPERLRLTYPDGKHDAEALLVEPKSGDILIVTKENGRARVYRAAAAAWGSNTAIELAHELTLGIENISAGDISRDGRWIALRREELGWLWRRDEGQIAATALRGTAARIAVRGRGQDNNGESIALHPEGRGYYTISEGKRQPIYFFPLQ